MTKANVLRIEGADRITLSTPKGVMSGFRWTGSELRHAGGRVFRFNPAVTAEISQTVAAYAAPVCEQRYGYQIQDGDRDGWVFVATDDAHALYSRLVSNGSGTMEVRFAMEDVIL